MDELIHTFSIKTLADFFRGSISSFKNEEEDLTYIIADKDYIDFSGLTRIGNVSFKNSDELIVFACKYNGILSERSSKKKQFEIAKLVLKEDFKDGAIFVFYDESGKFRFSFIRRNWDGKASKKYSSWKRFTYFVNPEEHNKTFRQRIGNCTFKDLDTIQEAFSVEKLTKEFYNDLFKWYQWTLTTEVGITFPNDTATSDDDHVKLEEQMIRLITRLLFVWFIKQKHLVPEELFKTDKLSEILKDFDPHSTSNGSYYNAILQNLFFATLNKAVIEREFAKLVDKRDIKTRYRYAEMFNISEEEVLNLFRPIPFLNGGLFECLDKEESTDGIKYHLDGFSRSDKKFSNGNFKHRAFIPNAVFFDEEKGLIPLLERYNFTVEENVPNEVQVALDPELLGNVFENLLGAFNPETQESARKQSGSFYTPKEIVAYMVDESLIAYLNNALPDLDEALIHQLFEQDTLPEFLANNHALCEKIAKELRAVKILDPACGSGAFPMGILNRMVEILEKLDAKNKASHHDLKLHLIEECIYGVDIQTIASQISKLRFFISLIVEQEAMDLSKPEENYGVLTLPNLETKFVAANTLIGMKSKPAQLTIFDKEDIENTKQELLKVRKEHFYAKSASAKKKLRNEDAQLRDKLANLLKESGEYAPEDAIQFSQWNPYDQNASSPFFDPEWMFGLEEGFDVVIGNPPYISTKGISVEFKKLLESQYGFADDTYNHFFFKGNNLLKKGGVLSYITPKTFWTTQTKRNLRDLVLSQTVRYIFDTANPFEAAMVDTCITSFSKSSSKENILKFLDGSKDLKTPDIYFIHQKIYIETQNSVIFKPTEYNLKIYDLYGKKVKDLYEKWWDKISTSKNISKNKKELQAYRESLKPGDVALLGCLTEGGQGLATANNGKYIAVRKSTKWAKNIIDSRPRKLAKAIKVKKIKIDALEKYANINDYLNSLSEAAIAELFDNLKEKYGRDIFGQGYIYRLVEEDEIADVEQLTEEEKLNGIDKNKKFYVPYDKGDKDGNRWYLETPFAIAWSKENVGFLKADPKARYQGYMYYFREGFCWTNILNPQARLLKAKLKYKSVNDVGSMSLSSIVNEVPNYFIVTLLNSELLFDYYREFINVTVNIQINDIRQLPIIIPNKNELLKCKILFDVFITIEQPKLIRNIRV
ncbi:Eco57I restriction-modification methylase [Candidatus Ornithobacterium hominis]|uniref:Eco57I restriction-modification methylase domain-containing protein n=1 Tax=Candidatus Ornithobacterium hominis TaxID=2497989 RepID=UPI000E96279C|nr:Eco57I restriction-modification methylase domain-containing protein [Candidatus Ornithobacterium hominis]SZD72667.1 Eco57I restriction-modification methylase [Candidatus Ornithobacterium hominis]